jgi:hypothetical protein
VHLKLHQISPLIKSICLVLSFVALLNIHEISAQSNLNSTINTLKKHQINAFNRELLAIDYFAIESETVINRLNLSKMGLTLHRKLNKTSAVVSIQDEEKFMLYDDEAGYQYYTINENWKLAPNFNLKDLKKKNMVWVSVNNENYFNEFCERHPEIKIIVNRKQFYKIEIPIDQLIKLKSESFIKFIELAESVPKAEATVLDLNLHPNRINTIHHTYPDLDGRSQTMAIKEPFYDIDDIDITNRYVSSGLESEFVDSHPLLMASIMVGYGNSFITGKGVAFNAFHTSSTNEDLIPDVDSFYQDFQLYTQNHSYGTQIESFYGVEANLYDQNVYDLENVLHVFSSGNSGMEIAENGQYQELRGFANITGNFKQSKNTLLVGAIDTANNIIEINSNGPAYDGRIKPEIMAYSMAGSSNASALVSGTALLLQEYFQNLYDSVPSASLMKSILINSADDVHHKGPDYKTGYGQLNAIKAIKTIEETHFISDEILSNESKEFSVDIPKGAVNFKATLTWTDIPANPNDEIAIVNDLDFQIAQNGELFLPWVLNDDPSINDLNTLAQRGEDHLNNIEQISIEQTEGTMIQLKVFASELMDSQQKFSISYQWEMPNQFEWTSPTGSDNISYNGATTSHLRWESSFPENVTGSLFFKTPLNEEWLLIQDNISLSKEQFRWEAPIIQDIAQLKMEIEGESFISDTFTLSAPVALKTGFNCSDSLSIYWARIPKVTHYAINHLVDGKMESLAITQDTTLTIDKTSLESNYLQLIPYLGDKPLIQSFTIDYNLQGSSCFLNSFFAEAIQDTGVVATVNLSSLSGISELILERKLNDSWQEITNLKPESLSVQILDKDAVTGFNDYRAVLYFDNGSRIVSDESTVYYVQDSKYKVFPNPFLEGDDLRVFSKEVDIPAMIQIISSSGKLIHTQALESNRNYLELDELEEGMYIYHILKDNIIRQTGKILKSN